MEQGRYEVSLEYPAALQVPYPRVEYRGCNFRMNGGVTFQSPTGCYTGCTLDDRIVVSTEDAARTFALITWETKNWMYIHVGHREKAI